MPLPPGSQLGPYTIAGPLGAGGMGEVYRARDSRLGRDVAIKVLSSSSSADTDRLQRFEQEARAAAALNHPKVAYTADESGQLQVYVVPFPGPGGKWQVSSAGGSYPRWRADGRELFYLTADGSVMSVDVDSSGAAFRAGTPRLLFRPPIVFQAGYQYAVTAKGDRFLMNTAAAAPLPVTVVSDWTTALKK